MLNITFFKKEIKEFIKTPKGLILSILFLFFAISSPLLAKYINEILVSFAGDLQITMPEPTHIDSWLQFYKNYNTICIIVYLIIVTGLVVQEKNKSTIILSLTKNVSRLNFLLSKFLASFFVYTVIFFASALITGLYTNTLFSDYSFDGLTISLIMLWLMGLFFTSLGLLISVISKTPTSAALFGFFIFAVLQILNISSKLALYNPAGAASLVNSIALNTVEISKMWIPILSTSIFAISIFVITYSIFKKQEI